MLSREAFENGLLKIVERDAKTFSVKKRKHTHMGNDVRTTEEIKSKKKKKKAIPEEDLVRLNESKRRKKHKKKMFNNADVCKTNVTPKVTNKMMKQKRKNSTKKVG